MNRRQAGFSFIEILVVMGIISVLVSMVVFFVPMIQERAKRTKSTDNVGGLLKFFMAADVGVSKGWPKYNGKNFVLWLVATNKIDRRDDKQLQILYSPGDSNYDFASDGGMKKYEGLTLASLTQNQDLLKLTSYAGRRNAEKEHSLSSSELSRGALVICDDDDGPLHHKDGLVIGYSSGQAKFVEWADLNMAAPDPDKPEGILGDNSPNDDLKHMSSGN